MKKYILVIVLFFLIILSTGCKKKIYGKWKAIDTDIEYYYIFNKDKTCSYEMKVARLDCTYEEKNENQIIISYDGSTKDNTFEYKFEKNTLIIKDTNGKKYKFIKEK